MEPEEQTEEYQNEEVVNLQWKWVEVKYTNSKNARRFLGQVLYEDQDREMVTIKFLKKVEFGKFNWPDIDTLHLSCITRLLPEPQMDRRDCLNFNDVNL